MRKKEPPVVFLKGTCTEAHVETIKEYICTVTQKGDNEVCFRPAFFCCAYADEICELLNKADFKANYCHDDCTIIVSLWQKQPPKGGSLFIFNLFYKILSKNTATPSQLLEAVTKSTLSFISPIAFSIATLFPTTLNMEISL